MPPRLALLDVQELDLEQDALLDRRVSLPEREALQNLAAHAQFLDRQHADFVDQRRVENLREREEANRVEDQASKAKELEDKLYSGTIKATKELEALQEEVRGTRDRQAEFEMTQMESLEEIDRLDAAMVVNRKERIQADEDAAQVREALAQAEAEIDQEMGVLAARGDVHRKDVPEQILVEYDRLRTKERLGGRAAAQLEAGTCGACRVRLPVIEYNRIRHEADDVLANCPRCSRVLVRMVSETPVVEKAL